ncbi:MAG: hypothetical protein ISS69_05970, partial [Phycisphaerae bacterium]|nr:hypothetical protein [Phycisphaerae bacterium]
MNIKKVALAGLVLAIAVICLPANVAMAQIGGFDPLGNKGSGELFTRADGGKIQAVIRIKIDSGWHLYDADKGHPKVIGTDTRITMGPESVKWSEVVFPKAHRILQAPELAGPGVWINSHEGTILLYALGEAAGAVSGDNITAKIDGQTCSDTGSCMLYQESLKSLGRGDDSLFAAFPANLSASDAPVVKSSADSAKPAPDDTTDYAAVT